MYQPCDVGIQRVLKHALKRAAHVDLVKETVEQLDANGGDADQVKYDTTLGTLRDRSLGWLLKAYEVCNNPAFIKKVRCVCTAAYTVLSIH